MLCKVRQGYPNRTHKSKRPDEQESEAQPGFTHWRGDEGGSPPAVQ